MRFTAFQKLEEVAVVAEIPAIVAEPTEEVAVIETTPQPTEYEVLRANAITEQQRASQAKLERVLDYTKQTMVAYMSEADLDRLCGYITEYSLGDTPCEVSPVSVDSALKSIDLMHFGWNIGKAFGKKRIHTATFIKNVFAHALRDIEVSTHRAQDVAHRIGMQDKIRWGYHKLKTINRFSLFKCRLTTF